MKTNVKLLAGFAALAMVTPSFAANYRIGLTGSSAFRSNTHTALISAPLSFTVSANTGSSASSAKYVVYTKADYPTSGDTTVIKTNWTGSVAGIQAVAQQRTDIKWLPDVGTGSVAAGANNAESLAVADGVAADIAFSDCFQDSTIFRTPVLTNTVCGIVQFRMVTNYGPGGVNPINSINYQQTRALYQTGSLPLSAFTGNPADTAKVYALGRDPDSGTRVTQLAESGVGANSTVVHYQAGFTGTAVSTLIPWPVSTVFGVEFAEGNGGYASGGDLAKSFRYDTSAVSVNGGANEACYFIAALGKSDVSGTLLTAHTAGTTVGVGPGKVIAFENNGDDNSDSSATIANSFINGTNPFWSYLNCMHGTLSAQKQAFYDTLTSTLKASGSSDIVLGNMKVQRNTDGGTILPGTRTE